MTKKAIILFFSLVTLTNLNVQNVYAENSEILTENINIEKDNRESFLVIPFFNWQGSNKNFYENMATGKFNRQLSYYPKFNIISDPELDKTIVEIDIDQNRQNILNFAREKRIKNILFCRFKENDNSFNDININQNDISSNNLINNQNFFNKRIVLEIEIVDVYTGETKVTITDSILQIRKQNGKSFYQMIESEFDKVIGSLIKKIDKEFLLKSKVTLKDNEKIFINKGKSDGVKVGMIFSFKKLQDKDAIAYNKEGFLRVISVSESQSEVIVLSGIVPDSETNIIESKNNPNIEGIISDLDISNFDNSLKINLGSNQGVKIGQVFKVSEKVDYKDKSGRTFVIGDKEKGLIYIVSTEEEQSIAKIIKGRSEIKNGMKISEYQKSSLEPIVKTAFYFLQPLTSAQVKRNNILRISTGYEDMRYKYYFDYGINTSIYEITENFLADKPANTTKIYSPVIEAINASLGYRFPIVPEYIYFSPLIQAGFGLSDSVYKSIVFDLTPKASFILSYSRFNLWLEGGYSLNLPIRGNAQVSINSNFIYGGGLSVNF